MLRNIDMNELTSIFFELIQVSDGKLDCISRNLSDDEWLQVCRMAFRQSMLGIAFIGLDKLPKEQCPSKIPMVKMYNEAEKIRRKNLQFDSAVPLSADYFNGGGFRCVLLKGQGVARLYPVPESRTPGDIDMWVWGSRKEIAALARKGRPDAKLFYHHVECADISECELEAHFTPSWMFNPIHNSRLQRWFKSQFPLQEKNPVDFGGRMVPAADTEFNRVFILLHIFRHLFDEGVGLRQVQDYYYVLKQGFSEREREETLSVLRNVGLLGFASAVMYVLVKVFALESRYLLVEPSEREGEFLLSEILRSGNFGQFDDRNAGRADTGELANFVHRMKRMVRFLRYYPAEVISAPLFKLYNFFIRHFV